MKNIAYRSCLLVISLLAITGPVLAGPLSGNMNEAAAAFRQLQKYIASADEFESESNHERISKALHQLENSFHTLSAFPHTYRSRPGFDSSVELFVDQLAGIVDKFDKNQKSAALWRLRSASNYCIACHISYNSKLELSAENINIKSLPKHERAAYLFATRNFSAAENEYWNIVTEHPADTSRNDALRKWLVLVVRSPEQLPHALTQLQSLLSENKLPRGDQLIIEAWVKDLQAWNIDPKKNEQSLQLAKTLLASAEKKLPGDSADSTAVPILRSTWMMNSLFEQNRISSEDRPASLLILGKGYALLPLYLYDGLGQMYLEQTILEAPDSKEARLAYKLLEEQLINEYSGNGLVNLPEDERKRLKKLEDKLRN